MKELKNTQKGAFNLKKISFEQFLYYLGLYIFNFNVVLFWPLVFVAAEFSWAGLKLYLTMIAAGSFLIVPFYPLYYFYQVLRDFRTK